MHIETLIYLFQHNLAQLCRTGQPETTDDNQSIDSTLNPAFSTRATTLLRSMAFEPTYVRVLSGDVRSNCQSEAGATEASAEMMADVQPPHFAFVLNFITCLFLYQSTFTFFSLNELHTTDTDEAAMAADANIGLSRMPAKG